MSSVIDIIKAKFYLIMLSVAALSVAVALSVPSSTLAAILGLSVFCKELILCFIPLIIFSCSYQCMYKLNKQGLVLLVLMMALIMSSNFVSSWVGFSLAKSFLHSVAIPNLQTSSEGLLPAFNWELPKWIANEKALFAGLLLGLSSRFFAKSVAARINDGCQKLSFILMNYVLLPILPLFMSGFIIKMVHDGLLVVIVKQCGTFALVLLGAYACYLTLGYTLVSQGNLKKALQSIKNMIGAGWLGFSTMSSLAALPLTLEGSSKNTHHKELVGGVLPISTNVHLVGDSIAIPFTALLMMASFFGTTPSLIDYTYFSVMLVLAKFSVAAVPGGGILIILPLLQSLFGFDAQMSALITLIYILLDPMITAANIMGNGLLVMIVDKCWFKVGKSSKEVEKGPNNQTANRILKQAG